MSNTRLNVSRQLQVAVALLFAGCVGTGTNVPVVPTSGAIEQLPTTTLKPDGAGFFSAVVIMHDCSQTT